MWTEKYDVVVLVLSVRSFTIRHHSVRRQLDSLGIPFEFIFRYDDPDVESEGLLRFQEISDMGSPERSIVLKHAEAWRIGKASSSRYLLVLEDDFVLNRNFFKQFDRIYHELAELPSRHLVNLGGANSKVPLALYRANSYFYSHWMETCEGYLCDADALKGLLEWLNNNLVDRPADHMIRKASQDMDVQHYWPKEALIEQGSLYGMFPSQLDKRRSKTSKMWLMLMYESKKFRRRTLRKWLASVLD
jgi:GR25 family glycosyltransferase involved in LPS biosynthesis